MAKEGTKKILSPLQYSGSIIVSIYKILTNVNKTLLILSSQFTNFEI